MKIITKMFFLFLLIFFSIKSSNAQDYKEGKKNSLFETPYITNFLKQSNNTTRSVETVSCLYDSVQSSQWDTAAMFGLIERKIYTYNANNDLLTSLSKIWNGATWIYEISNNYGKLLNTYNTSNKITNALYQGWSGTAWVNTKQYLYTYDVNNNCTGGVNQTWNGTTWVNNNSYSFTYDANNNMTILDNYPYHWLYTYDGNGNQASELFEDYYNGQWRGQWRNTYTYDANNNKIVCFYDIGNNSNSWTTWSNSKKYQYTYDVNNNQITKLEQATPDNGGTWNNSTLVSDTYNANNIKTHELIQGWNGTIWVNASQNNITLCSNNICLNTNVSQTYLNNSWLNNTKIDYFGCGATTSIAENTDNSISVAIYPNPFNLKTTISSNKEFKNATLKITDILGKEVKSIIFTGTQINLGRENLKNGIYFINIVSENKRVATGKLILIE